LLKAAVPSAARIAVLINPSNAINRLVLPQSLAAADKLGVALQTIEVRNPDELDGAFQAAARERADAIHVLGDSVTFVHRARIAELAAQSRLPAMYLFKEHVEAGGLMSYGPNLPDLHRRP